MFLRVVKISERKKKEVDAKHLLFYVVSGLRSSYYPWFKGLPVVSLVCGEGGNDAIFYCKKWV